MKIETDARMAFPRELCFTTYRDRLPELVPHLSNVNEIETLEREDNYEGAESKTRLLNVWRAVSEIPKLARAFIKPEMLAWHDYAVWNQDVWTVDWRVETHFFKERVACAGHNTFIDDGESCVLQIRGDLDVNLKGLPGVPRLVARKVSSAVEKFVVALITPNLTSVSTGVEAFLREQESGQ